ncbi:hypothetical protein D9758_018326 [Tetrapyrgos nigripes]|uniref:Uncharacterized protein n=1 Tax=Tetrapyrgos nigripes TaxID=182062 RepID=A0A8H5F1B5_9AGAR|nr:hypothetical protein D9758_018326 [Tetrapyrgos nigripes]
MALDGMLEIVQETVVPEVLGAMKMELPEMYNKCKQAQNYVHATIRHKWSRKVYRETRCCLDFNGAFLAIAMKEGSSERFHLDWNNDYNLFAWIAPIGEDWEGGDFCVPQLGYRIPNAVLLVSFSIDGTFVSAAGYGGITIWDLKTGQAVSTPHLPYAPFEKKHVYSSSVSLFFEESEKHVVIFGNMAGQVTVWYWDGLLNMFRMSESQNVYCNHPKHIMSMDVLQGRVPTNKDGFFVTSTSDSSVGVWKMNSKLILSNASCTIIVFSKAGGSFLQLNGSTGEPSWIRKEGPECMDSVALDESRGIFAAWTGNVGNVKQVAFAEEGSTLVIRTDYASAEVFSLDSGKRVQSLPYPGGSLVQYITTLTLPSSYLVAIVGSMKWKPAQVVVFMKKRFVNKSHSLLCPSLYTVIVWVVISLIIVRPLPVLSFVSHLSDGFPVFQPSPYVWTSQNSNAVDAPATFIPVTKRELVTYIDFDTIQVTFTSKLESYNPPGTSSITHSDKDEELTTIALH